MKGKSKIKLDTFKLHNEAPAPTANLDGLRVIVKANRRSSLTVGSPVFYRQIKIGSVEHYRLAGDSTGVEIRLFIDPEYSYLVRDNSIFYNATAIGLDVSLFSVKLSTETLATMINGGITMVVPEEPEDEARNMQRFELHEEVDDDWLEYQPVIIRDGVE